MCPESSVKIISNSAISLDGKLTTGTNDRVSLGSSEDLRRMSALRNWADAIVVGGRTYRNWPDPMLARQEDLSEPFNSKIKLNVIVSRSMDVPLTAKFFAEKTVLPLFMTIQENVPDDFPCEVVACRNEITPAWIVEVLEKRGVKNILIEAGGNLMFQFLRDNMIDEMHVTVCPKLIGGRTAPTLADGEGFDLARVRDLKLLKHETIGDEIFLHYRVIKKA